MISLPQIAAAVVAAGSIGGGALALDKMHVASGDFKDYIEQQQIFDLDKGAGGDSKDAGSSLGQARITQMTTPVPMFNCPTRRSPISYPYFDGKLTTFDLPLALQGTTFQKNVWREMQKIPYGQVQTYGDISGTLNSAARAVGGACGKNPIPIIIPCHRVIGGGGKMTGFSGGEGVETKIQLLTLEGYYL